MGTFFGKSSRVEPYCKSKMRNLAINLKSIIIFFSCRLTNYNF